MRYLSVAWELKFKSLRQNLRQNLRQIHSLTTWLMQKCHGLSRAWRFILCRQSVYVSFT